MKATLNSSRKQGKISKYIYGQFAEHLGRCIYEGLYVEDEDIPNKNGMRTDVVNALKELEIPVLRWPGAFTAVDDGQINKAIESSCFNAARDALNGWDPTGGAIYYYNPQTATNAWIRSRPIIKTIGKHVFCK